MVDVRVYEGIHFRFADLEARKQGRHVAEWTFAHFLRPIDDSDEDETAISEPGRARWRVCDLKTEALAATLETAPALTEDSRRRRSQDSSR